MEKSSLILEKRPFASLGIDVSLAGLGTMKFGRNTGVKYPGGDGFVLPSDVEISSILDLALDNGINLIDTAPAYGSSEERLGNILGARRDKFFIVTKTGEEYDGEKSTYIFTREHTLASIDRSLKNLKVDILDCVLVHCNRDDLAVMNDTAVMGTLADLKSQGKIRSYGASTHTVAGGLSALELGADAVMVAHNKGYGDEKPVIDAAAKKGAAVLVKKALASGHVDRIGGVDDNLRFIARTAGVTSIVIGSINPANILSNINALLKY